MAHHALRTRHALPLTTSIVRATPTLRAFTSSTRRRDDDEDGETPAASGGRRRGFRLKGREVRLALEWLDSTGEQYRRPRPGSTNYLQDKDGGGRERLVGGGGGKKGRQRGQDEEGAQEEGEEGLEELLPEDDAAAGGAERPSGLLAEMESSVGGEVEAAAGAEGTRARLQGAVKKGRLNRGPMPYGLNRYYRSERVLSEELREAIFAEWKQKEMPLAEISQRYQVCVERVAAVVRMKQIERDWLDEVRSFLFFWSGGRDDETFSSISLEDYSLVITLYSSDICLPPHSSIYPMEKPS
jgi:hypothetical protein